MHESANVYRDPWGATRCDLTITEDGHTVTGSSRSFDRNIEQATTRATEDARKQAFEMLAGLGIKVSS